MHKMHHTYPRNLLYILYTMSNNYQSGNPQGGNRQKKEIFNQWQAIGVLRPFKENDTLKFIPWTNGGVLNARLSVVEPMGQDENGNQKTRKFSIKVSIKTNKNITAQQLQSLVAGTKVRVVSRLVIESYEGKSNICADVYVLDILETPMAAYPQAPAPQYYPGGYPQYGQQPVPQTPPQYGNYPQAPAPQAPPQYGQYPPQYPPQPGVPPQYGQQPQQAPKAAVPPQAPPQYGQYPSQQPPWYKPAPEMNIDDLPEA